MPVAATFDWVFEDGSSLADLAVLDTMVTVVDCSTFLTELARGERLDDRACKPATGTNAPSPTSSSTRSNSPTW